MIALGFAVSVVMLLVVAAVGYFSIARIWNNAHKMGDTYELIDRLSKLSSMVQAAETGQRGYLLTGNDTYLEPYRAADSSIDNLRRQLRDLTADNPDQAHRLEQALP
ncbi:MAG: CHASE3 domain-containing protein, partial [Candidatus Binatus sp.]